MKKLLTLSLFIFVHLSGVNPIMGQNTNIKGVIIDSISQVGIEFANVLLFNPDSTFCDGTTTNSDGSFHLIINKKQPLTAKEISTTNRSYFIKVSCLGYKNKSCPVNDGQSIRIELGQNPILLNEVRITGKLNRVKNDASNMMFRVTDLIRANAFLATHILEQIPTLYVDFNNNVFVRGKGNVLILHNGVELADKALVNQIAPQAIERVEVSRTVPTKYLAKGYSAVVNIITKRSENMNLRVHGNASPNRLYDADLNFKIDKGKHSLYTFYKLYYRNFLEDLKITDSINSARSSYLLQVKPRIEFDNEFFYGYAYAPTTKTVMGIDGYLSLYHEHFQTKQKTNESLIDLSDAKTGFRSQNYAAYLQQKDSLNTLNARLNFTYKKVDGEIDYSQPMEDKNRENNYRFSWEVDYSRRISETLKLNAGVDYSYVHNRGSFSYSGDKDHYRFMENSLTAYFDVNLDWKKLSIVCGANLFSQNKSFRAESLNIKSTYFFPKFSGIYTIDSNNSLMLDIYSTQNQPTIWQLMPNPIRVTSTYIKQGNPYLKSENTARLALEYDYTKGSTYFSVVLFGEHMRNKIADEYTVSDNQQGVLSKINLKKSSNYGLSLSFNCDLFDWWSIRSGMDVFGNSIPENIDFKKHHASVNATITNVLSYEKWILALRYGYSGKELAYNGYYKPYNSSLAQLRYRFNSQLTFSLIWTQPIGSFKSERMVYYNQQGAYANHFNQIHTRSILFSFVYNIFNKSTTNTHQTYNNVDRKY